MQENARPTLTDAEQWPKPNQLTNDRVNGHNTETLGNMVGMLSELLGLPKEIEPEIYGHLWPDLASLSWEELHSHFATYGQAEGRQANRLATRDDFVGLIPSDATALEIGPFHNPLLRGPNARFFDVLSKANLIARAKALGFEHPNVPDIDFVSPTGDLSVVNQSFDYVISSHCLEHQPNLIGHLKQVERILRPGGRYFLLVPDKRYCFDAFIAESTIADVLDAHYTSRHVHDLKSVIEHRALTTHNDAVRHWAGDHGIAFENGVERVAATLREFAAAAGGYIDVHAWYFTPSNATVILTTLKQLGYISLVLERLYATRQFTFEFWAVLKFD